jgi:hypothetical protein
VLLGVFTWLARQLWPVQKELEGLGARKFQRA